TAFLTVWSRACRFAPFWSIGLSVSRSVVHVTGLLGRNNAGFPTAGGLSGSASTHIGHLRSHAAISKGGVVRAHVPTSARECIDCSQHCKVAGGAAMVKLAGFYRWRWVLPA